MANYITSLSSFIKQHRTECLCFALFIGLALFGHAFHEPTYDESQSWQIAKTASWHDMVLLLPVYEGHPPFWHLLLAVPAKLAIPWNIVYPLLGFVCMLASGFLIFFKAPFPRWVRCLLPFNFFLFYQYGIVVRPYCLITLLLLLLALFFPQKDKRPGLFVGLLALLCMCHLFGIAIAGGITLAWLWEIKAQRSWKEYIPFLFKDKRFHYLLALLALVIVILLVVFAPRAGYTFLVTQAASQVQQIIYIFAALPADAVLTNLNDKVRAYVTLLPWMDLWITATVGLLLWTFTLLFVPRKKVLFLLLPYLCMGILMIHYSSFHHVGLGLLLFVWYFWITLAQDSPITTWPKTLNKFAKYLLGACLGVPIAWNLCALYQNFRITTFEGKQIVAFLNKYNLMHEVIFSAWEISQVKKSEFITGPNMQPNSVMLNMYLDHNIIANFNNGKNKGYLTNAILTAHEREALFNQWQKYGVPMVTIGMPAFNVVYNDAHTDFTKMYRLAYISKECEMRKFKEACYPINLYLHENLWKKYGAQILKENGIDPTQIKEKPAANPANPGTNLEITIYR